MQAAHTPSSRDWDKIQIKSTDLGNKTYMLEGQGGNILVAIGDDGIIMVDAEFAPLHDKIKAAIKAISPLPIKYLVDTHFHGEQTGGNAPFHRDGAIVVAQDNVRVRLLAGTTNGVNDNKTAPVARGCHAEGDLCGRHQDDRGRRPQGGAQARLQRPYRRRQLDVFRGCQRDLHRRRVNNNHRYQQVDFANGGDIRGMIRGTNAWLRLANDNTKVVVGHGPLATKANVAEYNAMVKTARERIEKLVKEGKTEAQVVAAKPLADLDKTWAANDQAAANFVKQVYNSFSRS